MHKFQERISGFQDGFYDVVKYARTLDKIIVSGFRCHNNERFYLDFEDFRGSQVTISAAEPQSMRKMLTEIHDSIQPE
ncbi:hypothetical protein [Hafnia phage Pocis76]|uniref:Uncharacterized protein n=1 Tax=Hafnia phage Pocis76 TaxID=2831174 RepID=A0A8E7FN49_9CAUD|nr:hypothetical protein [Hafnia phage Pocis76]